MEPNARPAEASASVLQHLTIVQGVIQRMAENSRSCKLWCVTLVAATLVLVARTGEPQHTLLAFLPTFMLLLLDAYYLALERAFRSSYDDFVAKLHVDSLEAGDLYKVIPTGMGWRLVGRYLGSVSIWLFYPLIALMVILAWQLVLPSEIFS